MLVPTETWSVRGTIGRRYDVSETSMAECSNMQTIQSCLLTFDSAIVAHTHTHTHTRLPRRILEILELIITNTSLIQWKFRLSNGHETCAPERDKMHRLPTSGWLLLLVVETAKQRRGSSCGLGAVAGPRWRPRCAGQILQGPFRYVSPDAGQVSAIKGERVSPTARILCSSNPLDHCCITTILTLFVKAYRYRTTSNLPVTKF